MKVSIEIRASELNIKKAIAKGWNKRFNEELTHKDIGQICNKDDILSAIPFLTDREVKINGIE